MVDVIFMLTRLFANRPRAKGNRTFLSLAFPDSEDVGGGMSANDLHVKRSAVSMGGRSHGWVTVVVALLYRLPNLWMRGVVFANISQCLLMITLCGLAPLQVPFRSIADITNSFPLPYGRIQKTPILALFAYIFAILFNITLHPFASFLRVINSVLPRVSVISLLVFLVKCFRRQSDLLAMFNAVPLHGSAFLKPPFFRNHTEAIIS